MEVDHGPVIPADGTASARLFDESPLQSLVAAGYVLGDAPLAPPPWVGDPVQAKLSLAVVATPTEFDRLEPRC
jgi:hypothetical protein